MTTTLTCARPGCGHTGPEEDFPVDKLRRTGRNPYCRKCNRELQAEWRRNHPRVSKAELDRLRALEQDNG